MRPPGILRTMLLFLLIQGLASCANTRGGLALHTAMGNSMQRFMRSSTELVTKGTRRLTSFSRRTFSAAPLGADPLRRTRKLWVAAQNTGIRAQRAMTRGAASLGGLVTGTSRDAAQRTQVLAQASQKINPARWLANFRDESIKLINSLDLSRPILAGRGDPHLSGDPAVVRRPSFIERLLQRL